MKQIVERRVTEPLILTLVFALTLSPLGVLPAEEKTAAPEEAKTLKLPLIFGDHMVLQRDGVAPVWGRATPGEVITVTAGAVSDTATADANGRWIARLKNLPVSDTPIEVTVKGAKETLVFKDVLVGDVWFASGQSNMELGINLDSLVKSGLKPESNPLIRVFLCGHQAVAAPTENIPNNKSGGFGAWRSGYGGGQWGMGVSAVGYYFARVIQRYTRHPVGLIQSAISGSIAETWISQEALSAEPALSKIAEKALNLKKDIDDGKQPKVSEMATPCVNFNGGVNPYIPFAIKGAIWYQGESNSSQPDQYRVLLPAMIKDWRTRWGTDFSFLLVQLPTGVPEMAQAQAFIAAMPNNGLCVTYDIGAYYSVPEGNSRVHPNYKSGIGFRLALAARRVAYGDDTSVLSGPTCKAVKRDGKKMRVQFDNIGSGLVIGVPPADWYPKEPRVSTESLLGFFIAGKDEPLPEKTQTPKNKPAKKEEKKFYPATAVIEGDTVVVSSPQVPEPVFVRYGWYELKQGRNNLYNKQGLPAAPFRSDELFTINNPPSAGKK